MNFFAKIKYYLTTSAAQRAQNSAVLEDLELKCFETGRDMEQAREALRIVADGMSQTEVLRKACVVYLTYPNNMLGGDDLSRYTPMLVRENNCRYFAEGDKKCPRKDCAFHEKNIAYFAAKDRYDAAVAARDAFLARATGRAKNK